MMNSTFDFHFQVLGESRLKQLKTAHNVAHNPHTTKTTKTNQNQPTKLFFAQLGQFCNSCNTFSRIHHLYIKYQQIFKNIKYILKISNILFSNSETFPFLFLLLLSAWWKQIGQRSTAFLILHIVLEHCKAL